MKIIFITREGYNLPGARIRCYNFSKEFCRYGLDAEVLSYSDTLGAKDGQEESCMGIKDKIKFNYLAFTRLLKEKGSILYLQRFNYHAFAPYAAHILKGHRIILDLDDWEIREDPRYYFGVYPSSKAYYFTQQIAKRSIFCIAASRFLEDFLLQFNKNVYYVPSGVDTGLFQPKPDGLNKEETVFSWIGTLHRKEYIENIEFVLDCFMAVGKKHDNVSFEIVGDGIYRDDLLSLIKKTADERVRYKGWIDPEKIPGYLNSIHVGLFPVAKDSKFNRAKSPTKLFEYMAMAKATVSSSIGEPAYIIKNGENGFLADTKEKFIESMCYLVEDRELCKKIGLKARETIESDYSLGVLGKRLFTVLKQSKV